MDVREKLVELLAGCPCESDCEGMVGSCPHRKNGNCNEIFKLSYCAVSKLTQHLITNGITVQEWFSVSDSPKERGCYLVTVRRWLDGKPVVREAYWNSADWLSCYMRGEEITPRVTHWMPLPQPPKGE